MASLGGLAAVASFYDARFGTHHWQINAALSVTDAQLEQWLAATVRAFGGRPAAIQAAIRSLDVEVMLQAMVMTFKDMFLVLTVIALVFVPLVFLLRASAPGPSPLAVMH